MYSVFNKKWDVAWPVIYALVANLMEALAQVLQKKYIDETNVEVLSMYRWIIGTFFIQLFLPFTHLPSTKELRWNKIIFECLCILGWMGYLLSSHFALLFIPLSDVSSILTLNAIIVSLTSPIVTKMKLQKWTLFGAILGVVGVFIMSEPTFIFKDGNAVNYKGILIALTGAFSTSLACFASKKIDRSNLCLINYILYVSMSIFGIFQVLGLNKYEAFKLDCKVSLLLLTFSGVLTAVSSLIFSLAYQSGDSGIQALLGISIIPFSFAFEVLFNRFEPTKYTLIGGGILILGLTSRFFSTFRCKKSDEEIINNKEIINRHSNEMHGNYRTFASIYYMRP